MAAKWLKKLGNTLKKVAPTLVGGVAGEIPIVGDIVGPVLGNLMRKVTGAPAEDVDFEAMAEQIMSTPELQLELERLAIEREKMHFELEAAKLEADTARIAAVNETMRAEAGADDKWQRRWRPFWGFVSGASWGIIAVSFAITVLAVAFGWGADAEALGIIGKAMADMTMFFGIAGAVLGVSAWKRGDEKIQRIKTRGTALTAIVE